MTMSRDDYSSIQWSFDLAPGEKKYEIKTRPKSIC